MIFYEFPATGPNHPIESVHLEQNNTLLIYQMDYNNP